VDAVAIGADGYLCISGGKTLAMHAGVVLIQLVCAQAGVVLLHEGWIGMAGTAQLRDLFAIDLALPARLSAHGDVRFVATRVASMTACAGKTFLRVNVLAELLLRHSKRLRKGRVTVEAGVDGLPMGEVSR
jgi:hypothetical protein